jgi:kynureninase
MILITPPDPSTPYLPTSHIISTIQEHAAETALVLLPGIQFYSGQLFDIPTITAAARAAGVPRVGWDLAHAVGNAPLALHDADVDFAAWCHYKYLNSGPGAIGGLFVHERHGGAVPTADSSTAATTAPTPPRLSGWWGSDPATRFDMTNRFAAMRGAAGWQLSNPSSIDVSSLLASLSVFEQTSMAALRERSLRLTGYLEKLLDHAGQEAVGADGKPLWEIITPRAPEERGAQLSVRIQPGLMDQVLKTFDEEGVVIDERKPDVIRVAPTPLYNNFFDVWSFVQIFKKACMVPRAAEAK